RCGVDAAEPFDELAGPRFGSADHRDRRAAQVQHDHAAAIGPLVRPVGGFVEFGDDRVADFFAAPVEADRVGDGDGQLPDVCRGPLAGDFDDLHPGVGDGLEYAGGSDAAVGEDEIRLEREHGLRVDGVAAGRDLGQAGGAGEVGGGVAAHEA